MQADEQEFALFDKRGLTAIERAEAALSLVYGDDGEVVLLSIQSDGDAGLGDEHAPRFVFRNGDLRVSDPRLNTFPHSALLRELPLDVQEEYFPLVNSLVWQAIRG